MLMKSPTATLIDAADKAYREARDHMVAGHEARARERYTIALCFTMEALGVEEDVLRPFERWVRECMHHLD